MYNVDFFINKFEAIPEDQFTTGNQINRQKQKCFFGHCNPVYSGSATQEEYKAAQIISNEIDAIVNHNPKYGDVSIMANINNGIHPLYQQPTIKARILAALYDLKKYKTNNN